METIGITYWWYNRVYTGRMEKNMETVGITYWWYNRVYTGIMEKNYRDYILVV